MIITYLRSSSYNTWDMCQFQYYLNYVLGIKDVAGKAADKGTIVHKGLELLAKKKKAQQDKCVTVKDDEINTIFREWELTPKVAIDSAIDYYLGTKTHHNWTDSDVRDCNEWFNIVLNSEYNPLNLDIVATEKFFDIIFTDPEFYYSFFNGDNGGIINGYLGIKGTIDLIINHDNETIEMVDWKTGKEKKNWATGKEKKYKCFEDDFQLLLYYYALKKLYPGKMILVTIYYMRDGPPFSFAFDESHEKLLMEKIKNRFEVIKNSNTPTRIFPNWKCNTFCYYGKNYIENETICNHYYNQMQKIGLDKLTESTADINKATQYQEGGGRTHGG